MSVFALLLVGLVIAWRWNPHSAVYVDNGKVPRITAAEARRLIDEDNAILVDVRAQSTYHQSHLRGAVNVTTPEIEAKPGRFPSGKVIITYCS